MGGLTNVKVDKAASTMTITGAVRFIDVVEPLYAAGKEIRKRCVSSTLLSIRLNIYSDRLMRMCWLYWWNPGSWRWPLPRHSWLNY